MCFKNYVYICTKFKSPRRRYHGINVVNIIQCLINFYRMKRKFFSTLLFGALACATLGTVTSCKDYDDDINNLQEQINKAALSSDVEALKTQVTNAATSAQNAAAKAEEALTKAGTNATEIASVKALATENGTKVATALTNAANAAADAQAAAQAAQAAQDSANVALNKIAGLDSELKALAASAQTHVTATQLKASLDSLADVINQATSDSIAKLTTVVNGYKGGINALYTAVTNVSLVGSLSAANPKDNQKAYFEDNFDLIVKCGAIGKDIVFGKEEKDDLGGKHSATPTVTYTKDKQFGFTDEVIIRVSPANATVTPDMIKLLDSKGNDLDDVFEITEVKKFDELLTRGSGNNTGLWKVSVKPLLTTDKLNKAVTTGTDPKQIVYAIGVNNTASQAETVESAADRYVYSSYDLAFEAENWTASSKSLHDVLVYSENTMGKSNAIDLHLAKIRKGETDYSKHGQDKVKFVSAASGETVIVDCSALVGSTEYFYVVRDDSHAGESDASEINAWNTYSYTGLNTIYKANEDGKISVTIPSTAKAGDEIAFRVFGIQYDGTYTPSGDNGSTTGHSFSVYVTDQNATASVAGDIKVTGSNTAETAWLPVTGKLTDNGAKFSSYSAQSFTLETSDGETWTVSASFAQDAAGKTSATKNSEIKYVKFTATLDGTATMSSWTDGATASTAYAIKENDHNTVTDIFNISLTKVLPTAADAKAKVGYQWKDKQLVNGVYTAYLYPTGDNWKAAATTGYKDLHQAINGLANNANAYLHIENATTGKADNTYDGTLEVKGGTYNATSANTGWNMTISNAAASRDNAVLIDNKTEHNAVFGYNYGKVSSADANNEYKVDVTEDAFKIVFACPLDPSVQTFQFNNYVISATSTTPEEQVAVNELYYNAGTGITTPAKEAKLPTNNKSISRYIVATNTFDNSVFGGSWFGTNWAAGNVFNKYILDESTVELTSNGTDEVDYFTCKFASDGQIQFTQISGTTNPPADVPSTLKLTLKDCFGHQNVYTVPFTVLRRD